MLCFVSNLNIIFLFKINFKFLASKKAKNVLQSTAIDADLRDKRRLIKDEDRSLPKTPINKAKEAEIKKTPRSTRLIRQTSVDDYEEENKERKPNLKRKRNV